MDVPVAPGRPCLLPPDLYLTSVPWGVSQAGRASTLTEQQRTIWRLEPFCPGPTPPAQFTLPSYPHP